MASKSIQAGENKGMGLVGNVMRGQASIKIAMGPLKVRLGEELVCKRFRRPTPNVSVQKLTPSTLC